MYKHLTEKEELNQLRINAVGEVFVGLLIIALGIILFLYLNTRLYKPISVVEVLIPLVLSLILVFSGAVLTGDALNFLIGTYKEKN